jgi:hypothetical protein
LRLHGISGKYLCISRNVRTSFENSTRLIRTSHPGCSSGDEEHERAQRRPCMALGSLRTVNDFAQITPHSIFLESETSAQRVSPLTFKSRQASKSETDSRRPPFPPYNG